MKRSTVTGKKKNLLKTSIETSIEGAIFILHFFESILLLSSQHKKRSGSALKEPNKDRWLQISLKIKEFKTQFIGYGKKMI